MSLLKYILNRLVYGGGIVFDLAKWLIIGLVLFSIVNTFFYAIFVVDGASMAPNFKSGELILWDKHAYTKADPARRDIVVLNYPGDPYNKKYVKRVIGLPNEKIDIIDGIVYVGGKALSEPYLSTLSSSLPDGSWQLGSNEYFVMGDNRPNSNDSRYFGPVEKRFILGRSITVIYPRVRLTSDI